MLTSYGCVLRFPTRSSYVLFLPMLPICFTCGVGFSSYMDASFVFLPTDASYVCVLRFFPSYGCCSMVPYLFIPPLHEIIVVGCPLRFIYNKFDLFFLSSSIRQGRDTNTYIHVLQTHSSNLILSYLGLVWFDTMIHTKLPAGRRQIGNPLISSNKKPIVV